MATASVEERLAALEAEVAQLKARLETERNESKVPWWDAIFGTFADSEGHEEAMRLGREYRESLRPKDDEDQD
jgi:hypothetical protein